MELSPLSNIPLFRACTQTRFKGQYNVELTLSPRLHVKPLVRAIKKGEGFNKAHGHSSKQIESDQTWTAMHDIKSDAFIRSNCDYFENILYYALLFLRKAIGVDFVVYKAV